MELGKKIAIGLWSAVAIAVIPVVVLVWAEQTGRAYRECVDYGVVQTIDRVNHRTAYVTLEDGRSVSFNQPRHLVPGKEVCLKSEVVYDF